MKVIVWILTLLNEFIHLLIQSLFFSGYRFIWKIKKEEKFSINENKKSTKMYLSLQWNILRGSSHLSGVSRKRLNEHVWNFPGRMKWAKQESIIHALLVPNITQQVINNFVAIVKFLMRSTHYWFFAFFGSSWNCLLLILLEYRERAFLGFEDHLSMVVRALMDMCTYWFYLFHSSLDTRSVIFCGWSNHNIFMFAIVFFFVEWRRWTKFLILSYFSY
jgi:hypothetical protein